MRTIRKCVIAAAVAVSLLGVSAMQVEPASATDYRAEITAEVIRPCVLHSVRSTGLSENMDEEDAADIIMMMNHTTYEEAIDVMVPLVTGQPLELRRALYAFGLQNCINGAAQ